MLTAEQLNFYHENGYILVPGLLSAEEAASYRRETHEMMERLAASWDLEATWESARGVAEVTTRLQHCHEVQFQSAAFSRLIMDPRLTGIAAQLIGGPNVELHHTKAFVKPPEQGSPFPMHQDAPYFPHEKHSLIAAIFHFDDAPLEKGCVRMLQGSHKLGPLPHIETGSWHLPPEEYPIDTATPLPAEAGDVIFFSYLTVHGSGINSSSEARTTLLIQMRDPLDTPTEPVHESRGQGMMLSGINPTVRIGSSG